MVEWGMDMNTSAPSRATAFAVALERLRSALSHVANGNIGPIKALYSHSDDATSFYGWGGYEKGWDEVSRRWDWAAQQFKGGTVSHRNITTVIGEDLAYTTDIETFSVKMPAMEQPTQWANRVTHVFRFEDGDWRLLHRHANRLEDQYEPAPRLKGR
jgi:ketosteroid isomerase-like protein